MKDKSTDRRLREGCLICKLRHVKCDGNRPACNNCRDSRRKCVGFSPVRSVAAISKTEPGLVKLWGIGKASTSPVVHFTRVSTWPQWSQREIRSFSYGLQKTIPNITFYFESDFWGKQIPKLAHSIPAVRHALNALASFHEKSMFSESGSLSPESLIPPMASVQVDKFFLQQYNKAIEGLSCHSVDQGLSKSVCILVCCALFVCLEGLHGRHRAMVNHLQNGLKVFHEWVRTKHPDTQFVAGSLEASVYETFQRIDFHAAAFLENHAPQSRQLTVIQHCPQPDVMRPFFDSIFQARSYIDMIYGRTFLFLKTFDSAIFEKLSLDRIPSEISAKHSLLTLVTSICAAALGKFDRKYGPTFTPRELRSTTMLKIRIKIIHVFIRKWPYEHAPHKEVEPDFQAIINLSRLVIREHLHGTPIATSDSEQSDSSSSSSLLLSSPSSDETSTSAQLTSTSTPTARFDEPPTFTLEVGLLPILYYIALSSSTLSVRSDAVHLLRSANLREGLWSSSRAASMAEQQLIANDWQRCPVTSVEMSDLTKRLWQDLQIE